MDLKQVRPLGDRVIVEVDDSPDTTKGGIIIPENAKEPLTRGVVIAAGPGKVIDGKMREVTVKVGDRVLFGKYSGSDVDNEDRKPYKIMPEDDLLGVIED
jgi:chaperonin GroES